MEQEQVQSILQSEDPALDRLLGLKKAIFLSQDLRKEFNQLLKTFKGTIEKSLSTENKALVRLGVCYFLSGNIERASQLLSEARTSKERDFFLGLCHLESGRNLSAYEHLKTAHDTDNQDIHILRYLTEAQIKCSMFEDAQKTIEKIARKFPDKPDHLYLQGFLYDIQGFHKQAIESYEKALEIEPDHQDSVFRLAYKFDTLGYDNQASELYDQLKRLRPLHVNTLMNLGIIYEDKGEYNKAIECYETILENYPDHWKATMYLKDAIASLKMFYDEEALKKEERKRQLASQHIADLNMSTRTKNALQKSKIFTLADLISRTEEDLHDISGLGQSSVKEIKELLHSKGLSLSSAKDINLEDYLKTIRPEILNKPLSDFEWSGRVKKLFDKLGFIIVTDLVKNTEKELLLNKNFGQTSLKEIKQRLATLGIQLRTG